MPFVLPKAPSPATARSPRMLVIYGPPKVGKTTAVSQLPNCLDIDIEEGSDYIESLKVKCSNLQELRELVKEIQAQGKPYPYVALDTVTKLEEWAEQLATQQYKASVIGSTFKGASVLELPNGAGYLHLRNAFVELVYLVRGCADRVIYLGHLRDKMLVGGPTGKSDTQASSKDLDLTGKCKQILCAMCDAIGFMYRASNMPDKIFINFNSAEQVTCGSRCAHLKGQNMELDWKKIFID